MPLKVKISDFSPVPDLNSGDLIPIIRDDGSKKNKNVTVLNLEQHILGQEDGSGIHVSGSSSITGSLSITNDITCSGNLTILGAIVNTLIISSSQVDIGDNIILLNTLYPHQRYAGIEVYDSGSTNASSSFLWDGSVDTWGLSNLSASGAISSSTIRGTTSITSPIGSFTNLTASNITASGYVSASNVVINGTLVNGSSNVALGTYSHAEGFFTIASGEGSHTEGAATKAIGNYSHAEGLYTSASGIYSHAEGQATWAQGERTHAEGYQTTASGDTSHAEGNQTTALGIYSHAEGYQTIASESFSHSEGNLTTASGFASHAEGQSTRASGQYSHAEGRETLASGSNSHAEGSASFASGITSHAEGKQTHASGSDSHAEGYLTVARGLASHAEGSSSLASGIASHAEGFNTTASGNYSHAEGSLTTASGDYSHAEGVQTYATGPGANSRGGSTRASGAGAHSEGYYTTASMNYSHAEGAYTIASSVASHAEGSGSWTGIDSFGIPSVASEFSHAEGLFTRTGAVGAHAEGSSSLASGIASHAEGYLTTASGQSSHAEGQQTIASGTGSHAEGRSTKATGLLSHAEGLSSTSSGDYSHAEGSGCNANGSVSHAEGGATLASGVGAHSEGAYTSASGETSHAEGSGSLASGHSSHAEGMFTTASGVGQHVSGKFNVASANSNDLFIIGNGTSAARSNILVVNTSSVIVGGNISASGDLTASNILINGGSINKVEKFLGLNTSSFGTGTLTNERSKTTDDVIYTSASVDYLLHVHHNSASLQIYNLQTRNLVSNVSLTSGKNPNSIYLEGNKAFVGCYGSGSIAIVDISNINSPTTTYASSLTATSYTDDNNFVDPIVFKGNFIFGNISSVKIYNTSSVTSVSSTGVGTRITALHAYTSASVDVLLVLGYGSAGSAGTAFLFAYNITTPSAPVLMSQAPVLNTVLQPLPTAAERFCALTVDRENKYAYVGDSTSNVDDTILRVFDLSDLNFIKTIAEVKLNNGYYPFGTPVINRVSLTSYNTVLVTDTNNKRTFEFDLYDIKKQNGQLVVPIKIYTFNDTPTSVKFFKQQLSEDVIVVSTLNGNISFQNKSNKFIINSVNSDGTDSKNSILSLNNFTANISGSLIVSDNINCKTTINASELQFPNHSKIKSDSNYIRTLSSNHVIISEPTLGYNAAFYDYCVYSGSNIRAGVIAAAFSAGTVFYNETTTADIGNTEQVTMSVTCSGDFIQLLSNASTNVSWSIKAMARYI